MPPKLAAYVYISFYLPLFVFFTLLSSIYICVQRDTHIYNHSFINTQQQDLIDQLQGVFDALHEKEERVEKVKSISSIDITAFHCQECDRFYEKYNRLCAARHHRVKKVQTKKRFFVCGNHGCRGEATAIGTSTAPSEACGRCGEKLWRKKGKGSGKAAEGAGGSSGNGGAMGAPIGAIAEWSRNQDISQLYN
jgi:hypothetical protein